ncbi:MAG: STAS domain-containing protein [Gaiellaceae bacterium]
MEFDVEGERPTAGVAVVSVVGEVDLHVASVLRERLTTAVDGADKVVIDLSGVTFVDSMALSVIVGAGKRARARRAVVRLVVPRREIRRVFEITLLDRVFPLDESREAALAAVQDG